MNLTKLCKCCFKEGSIGIITLYNAIVSIIDLIFLILALVLLTDGDANIGDIAGVIFLVFAIIALPCVICGICYVWSLFHIQTHLRMARFFGVCNFVMMILTFIIIVTNLEAEEQIENPGVMAFFMIVNVLGLVSVIFLCTINCGFEDDEVEIREVPQNALPAPLRMEQVTYPDPEINEQVEVVVYNAEDCEEDRIQSLYVEEIKQLHQTRINRMSKYQPSAPYSPSIEGRPTLR